MTDPEKMLGWVAILLFVTGGFLAFLRARAWYYRRGASRPDDVETWPQLRLSLRRDK